MKDLRFGDFVWLNGQGWQYLGMGEDGEIQFCRPLEGHAFNAIEFNALYPDEVEEYDQFLRDNGESLSERSKRHGTMPEGVVK